MTQTTYIKGQKALEHLSAFLGELNRNALSVKNDEKMWKRTVVDRLRYYQKAIDKLNFFRENINYDPEIKSKVIFADGLF